MPQFIKKHKFKIIAAAAVLLALTAAFFAGGELNDSTASKTASSDTAAVAETDVSTNSTEATVSSTKNTDNSKYETASNIKANTTSETSQIAASEKPSASSSINSNSSKASSSNSPTSATIDKYQTEKIPEGKPMPVEPQEQETKGNSLYCTFSISCATILDNMSDLTKGKESLVPSDGWILKPVKVKFNEGESVYDVLQRVCRDNAIHMEASFTPVYNSAYVEGINNLYEFDCGSLSGWEYSVNGWFPNYGCSRYQLSGGDVVAWQYTCNLGEDIGASFDGG